MGARKRYTAGDKVELFTRNPYRDITRVKSADLKPGMVMDNLPNPGWEISYVVELPNDKRGYEFVYGYVYFENAYGPMTLEKNACHNIYTHSIKRESL